MLIGFLPKGTWPSKGVLTSSFVDVAPPVDGQNLSCLEWYLCGTWKPRLPPVPGLWWRRKASREVSRQVSGLGKMEKANAVL